MVSKPTLVAASTGVLVHGLFLIGLRFATEPHDAYDMGIVAVYLTGAISFFVGCMVYLSLSSNP